MSSPRPRTEPGDPDRPRLWSLLAHGLTQYPDAQLQGEDGEVVTFKQLHEQVLGVSSRLNQLLQRRQDKSQEQWAGVADGGHPDAGSDPLRPWPLVGLHLSQSVEYITLVLAAIHSRVPFLPLDPTWPQPHLQRVLHTAHPTLIVSSHTDTFGSIPKPIHTATDGPTTHGATHTWGLAQIEDTESGVTGNAKSHAAWSVGTCMVVHASELISPGAHLGSEVQPPAQAAVETGAHASGMFVDTISQFAAAGGTGDTHVAGAAALAGRSEMQPPAQADNETGDVRIAAALAGAAGVHAMVGGPHTDSDWQAASGIRGTHDGEAVDGAAGLPTVMGVGSQDTCCYVLFTSGSTGEPLGVCGTERGLVNRILWQQETHPLKPGDLVAIKTAVSFVDSLWEILGPIAAGASLALMPRALRAHPAAWAAWAAARGVTHLVSVPSLLRIAAKGFCEQQSSMGGHAKLRLRVVVSSGEPLDSGLATELLACLPDNCTLINLYGSTEVAADVTCHVIPRTSPHTTTPTTQSLPPFLAPSPQPPSPHWVPAGAPIRNTAILILPWTPEETTTVAETDKTSAIVSDKSAAGLRGGGVGVRVVRPCARGVVGQVCVVGAGLARGYLGSPAATAARSPRVRVATQGDLQHVLFGDVCSEGPDSLKTALMSDEGVVAFLTGDLGQINQDDFLEVLGRTDHQVKISGARVDLLSVEQCVIQSQLATEAAAVVLPTHHTPGDDKAFSSSQHLQLCVAVVMAPANTTTHTAVGTGKGTGTGTAVQASTSAPTSTSTNSDSTHMTVLSMAHPMRTAIRRWVAAHLPAAAVPAVVAFAPALPRNPAGKLLRGEVRRMLQPLLTTSQNHPDTHTITDPNILHKQQQDEQHTQQHPHQQQHQQQRQRQQQEQQIQQEALTAHIGHGAGDPQRQPYQHPHQQAQQQQQDQQQAAVAHIGHGTSQSGSQAPGTEPGDATTSESHCMRVLVSVLGYPRLEPADDYIDLGLSSLQAAEVAGALGCEPALVLAARTVRRLAGLLRTGGGPQAASDASAGAAKASGDVPVVPPAKRARSSARALHAPVPTMRGQAFSQRVEEAFQSQGPMRMCVRTGTTQQTYILTRREVQLASTHNTVHATAPRVGSVQTRHTDSLPHDSAWHTTLHAAASGVGTVHTGPSEGLSHDSAWKLHGRWRQPLGRCIDAAPVLVTVTPHISISDASTDTVSHTARPNSDPLQGFDQVAQPVQPVQLVLAASHDGDVAACDAATGACAWRAQLPTRVDVAVTLAVPTACVAGGGGGSSIQSGQGGGGPAVVAAGGTGQLFCMDMATGKVLSQYDLGGEPRSAPVTDPWHTHIVWVTTHSRHLLAVSLPSATVLCREPLPAASSVSPVFSITHRSVIVCCVDGTVLCYQVHSTSTHTSPSTQQLPAQMQSHPLTTLLWRTQPPPGPSMQASGPHKLDIAVSKPHGADMEAPGSYEEAQSAALTHPVPVFSTPYVDDIQGCVVVAHVDGYVRCLRLGDGSQCWTCQLDGHTYAALCPLHHPPHTSHTSTPPPLAILAVTHAGTLWALDPHTGTALWSHNVGHGKISCAPVTAVISQPSRSAPVTTAPASAPTMQTVVHVCVASSVGVVSIVRLTVKDGSVEVSTVDEITLPGESYSTPVWHTQEDCGADTAGPSSTAGGTEADQGSEPDQPAACLFLGCRDDHLYCIELQLI